VTTTTAAVRPWTILVLAAALLLGAVVPAADAATVTPDHESRLVALINDERTDRGLAPLDLTLQLTRIGRDWSQAMARQDDLSHRPDLAEQIDGDWRRLGENVGYGPSLDKIHDAFMDSKGHRDNVLGDFDRVGVGVVEEDGRLWITVNFLRGRGDFPLFSDIITNPHRASIENVFARAITSGCRGDRYCPGDAVTRAQMATFLTRELGLTGRSPGFGDVARTSPHADAIGALAAAGITDGCGEGRFCPNAPVSRAQMATFLTRALDLPERAARGVDDVPSDHAHVLGIGALQAAGITEGCGARRFCPDTDVSRAQMATFLTKAFD
jgi:hypothetical protein